MARFNALCIKLAYFINYNLKVMKRILQIIASILGIFAIYGFCELIIQYIGWWVTLFAPIAIVLTVLLVRSKLKMSQGYGSKKTV